MNRAINTKFNVDTFRIWDYPVFVILLGYVWIEMINPLIAYSVQIIPKIPNSAIALILCYMIRPKFIRQIHVPINPVKWALPFLIIATINVPFIKYAQYRSIVELIGAWFWVLVLVPLMIRVLATQSGRWHFVLFSAIGLTILCLQYYIAMYSSQFIVGNLIISRHHLAPGVIAMFPILIGYIYIKKGLARYCVIICLIIIMFASIPAGARSMWLILPIELLLIALFVLPKSRLMVSGMLGATIFFIFLSFWDISEFYSGETLDKLEIRLRKGRQWQEDNTVWKRLGMVVKVRSILEERPILGVGYSNRSFADFDGGDIEFMGHLVRVRQVDAHNTYFNILGGTGILGFLAFLYYMMKVFIVFRKIPISSWINLNQGPFIVSTIGSLMHFHFATSPFSVIAQLSAVILALYIYQYNLQISSTLLPERS